MHFVVENLINKIMMQFGEHNNLFLGGGNYGYNTMYPTLTAMHNIYKDTY